MALKRTQPLFRKDAGAALALQESVIADSWSGCWRAASAFLMTSALATLPRRIKQGEAHLGTQ